MRRLQIVEIENSYLNFFTPAVIIAAGFFLFDLILWPLRILQWLTYELEIPLDYDLYSLLIPNISAFLICLIVYFVFIPRLNVLDADSRQVNRTGFVVVSGLFLCAIFFRILLMVSYGYLGVRINFYEFEFPFYISSYYQLSNPVLLSLFFLYRLIALPLFLELIYRRTVIPLMEDRGLSPFHAVILSSVGFIFVFLPDFIRIPNLLGNIFWIWSTFLFGLATGTIYILTRNVIFSILYNALYHAYRLVGEFGYFFQDQLLILILTIINVLVVIGGAILIIYIIVTILNTHTDLNWVSIIKQRSVPNITLGTIGFFIIALVLIGIQVIVTTLINTFALRVYPDFLILYSIFYLIIFSIPFLLTITSEYSQSKLKA